MLAHQRVCTHRKVNPITAAFQNNSSKRLRSGAFRGPVPSTRTLSLKPHASRNEPKTLKTVDLKFLELIKDADKNKDGKLTVEEVQELFLQLEKSKATKPTAKPPTWDIALYKAISESMSKEGLTNGFLSYAKERLSIGSKVSLYELVYSLGGMFITMYVLGHIADARRDLPFVGRWHKEGLGVMIGSLGTLSVLLFSRPESEPVRAWNFVAGHLLPVFIGALILRLKLPVNVARATAMAVGLGVMMLTDSVHPPGGALILLLVDTPAAQKMGEWFLVYPSMFYTLLVLVPVAIAVNWLKRNARFLEKK